MVDEDYAISQGLPLLLNICVIHVVCPSKVLGHLQSLIEVKFPVLFHDPSRNYFLHHPMREKRRTTWLELL